MGSSSRSPYGGIRSGARQPRGVGGCHRKHHVNVLFVSAPSTLLISRN